MGHDFGLSDKTEAIIFDCDGTLADTMPLHFVAWTTAMNRHGIEFSEERFYTLAGTPPFRIIEILATEQGVTLDAEAAAAEKESLYLTSLAEVQPIDPVVQLARDYHGRLPLAVASGSSRDVVTRTLTHLNVIELFTCVVTSEDTQRHKPDPDVFLKAAELLGIPPAGCLVLEDADGGIVAAQRAGMGYFDVRTIRPGTPS